MRSKLMLMRIVEDMYFVGRFAWFYYRAPDENFRVGFSMEPTAMPVKTRAVWAYRRALGNSQR